MLSTSDVVAYGIDYVRYRIWRDADLEHIQRTLPYLDVQQQYYHGYRHVNLTGKCLELIRQFEEVNDVIRSFAWLYPVKRLDVFVDVLGDRLPWVRSNGTKILNAGRVETIYSAHLSKRGNLAVFGRAYDAELAGHYDFPVTRLEIEYKRHLPGALLTPDGWREDPIGVALKHVYDLLGIDVQLDEHNHIDFNAPCRRLEHSRERFYTRYGKGILNDVESMGVQGLVVFVQECVRTGET